MGSDFRSCELNTEESRLMSGAVRSSLVSAFTRMLVATDASGRMMRSRAAANSGTAGTEAAGLCKEPGKRPPGAATSTGVRTVSNPGSETTKVKLPVCGATIWKLPSSSE